MGIFNRTKKSEEEKAVKKTADVSVKPSAGDVSDTKANAEENKTTSKKEAKEKKEQIKGGSVQAYRTLIKPMITEKASVISSQNKYMFMVDPNMNKIEIKKAIIAVYNVKPVSITTLNFSGKKVRYGRTQGEKKNWKKAIVTLKPEDKIEVYEGV